MYSPIHYERLFYSVLKYRTIIWGADSRRVWQSTSWIIWRKSSGRWRTVTACKRPPFLSSHTSVSLTVDTIFSCDLSNNSNCRSRALYGNHWESIWDAQYGHLIAATDYQLQLLRWFSLYKSNVCTEKEAQDQLVNKCSPCTSSLMITWRWWTFLHWC